LAVGPGVDSIYYLLARYTTGSCLVQRSFFAVKRYHYRKQQINSRVPVLLAG